jgi:hypothetical protein
MLRYSEKVDSHDVPRYGLVGAVITNTWTAAPDDTCRAGAGARNSSAIEPRWVRNRGKRRSFIRNALFMTATKQSTLH